jgi:hypothetical protein
MRFLGYNIVQIRSAGPGPVWSLVQSGLIMLKTGPEARRITKSSLRAR